MPEITHETHATRKRAYVREENRRMIERTGAVSSSDPLVAFLYVLGRDHLPLGEIESAMDRSAAAGAVTFCNGHLARYAEDVAARLRKTSAPEITPAFAPPPSEREPADIVRDALGPDWRVENDQFGMRVFRFRAYGAGSGIVWRVCSPVLQVAHGVVLPPEWIAAWARSLVGEALTEQDRAALGMDRGEPCVPPPTPTPTWQERVAAEVARRYFVGPEFRDGGAAKSRLHGLVLAVLSESAPCASLADLVEVQRAMLGEMLTRRRSREWDEDSEGAEERYVQSCADADVHTAAALAKGGQP